MSTISSTTTFAECEALEPGNKPPTKSELLLAWSWLAAGKRPYLVVDQTHLVQTAKLDGAYD